jgi:hypothetical protein
MLINLFGSADPEILPIPWADKSFQDPIFDSKPPREDMTFSWSKTHESSWLDTIYKWANENPRDIDFCASPIMTRKLGWEGRNYKIYIFNAEPPKHFPSVVNVPQQHAQRHPQVPGKPGTRSLLFSMSFTSCRWRDRSRFLALIFRFVDVLVLLQASLSLSPLAYYDVYHDGS